MRGLGSFRGVGGKRAEPREAIGLVCYPDWREVCENMKVICHWVKKKDLGISGSDVAL